MSQIDSINIENLEGFDINLFKEKLAQMNSLCKEQNEKIIKLTKFLNLMNKKLEELLPII